MNSMRCTVLTTGLAVGMMSQCVSAQQDWSRFLPPPVTVADVPGHATSTQRDVSPNRAATPQPGKSVLQASHFESEIRFPTGLDTVGWSGESFGHPFDISGPPPHRIIQAPAQTTNRSDHHFGARSDPSQTAGPSHTIAPSHTASPGGQGDHAAPVDVATSSHSGHRGLTHHGLPHHGSILPELPGVENDPKSAGPGHLGLGTHWIRERPRLHPPIPGATVAPRWKTPYSYGHFGAEGKRSWTRQHGYRDRYLQWSLR